MAIYRFDHIKIITIEATPTFVMNGEHCVALKRYRFALFSLFNSHNIIDSNCS